MKKLPTGARVLLILLLVPAAIALARVGLEHHFSKLTAMCILIATLTALSLPLMFKTKK